VKTELTMVQRDYDLDAAGDDLRGNSKSVEAQREED
jgi:hypothetical protein